MIGLEPRTFGVGSDCNANYGAATAINYLVYNDKKYFCTVGNAIASDARKLKFESPDL